MRVCCLLKDAIVIARFRLIVTHEVLLMLLFGFAVQALLTELL